VSRPGPEHPTAFVSTGELPPRERVRALVDEAYERFAAVDEGTPSPVYPALAQAPRELFGICVVGARGGVYGVGDADVEFTIMSVAKPFVFALVCAALGAEEIRRRIGVNATAVAPTRW
jgi:glutaminase